MITDQAWALIVDAAPGGIRGRRFAMSRRTASLIQRERGKQEELVTLYGVWVRIDETVPLGRVLLGR